MSNTKNPITADCFPDSDLHSKKRPETVSHYKCTRSKSTVILSSQ